MVRGGAVLAVKSSGVTRQSQGGRDPDNLPPSLPACHKHYTYRGGGRRWGLGLRPTGCGSCCFPVSGFNCAVSDSCCKGVAIYFPE